MALTPAIADQLLRIRAQITTGQPEWGAHEERIPVERYFDAGTRDAEVQALFRRLPLIAAHSSELAPGQAVAHDAYDVPMLLTRDAAGTVRCFLNVCRHRGMRLLEAGPPTTRTGVACPYHGWSYKLDGRFRHMLHAEAFEACPEGARDLVALPCAERHGLIWVIPDQHATLDLDAFLGGLGGELDFLQIADLQLYRTIESTYPANWKLIVDAFLEPYHIRVLHKDTIYPFFTDGITSAARFGPHIQSLVARRSAEDWAKAHGSALPAGLDELRLLASPSQVIFPNAVTIFHPDYLSLVTLYPCGPETLRWTHRMLIPKDKTTPDWTPHWEKTFQLIDGGVFEKEDIACAVGIQKGLKTGANDYLTVGRIEQAVAWFHASVTQATEALPQH